jgi:hypothetical protein
MPHRFPIFIGLIVACIALASCERPEVHVHDRSSLSYPIVSRYARKHRGTTLILFDYHHCAGPEMTETLSSNWISALVHDGMVSQVLWISGRDLLLPNKNSRIAWLRRNLSGWPPSEASDLESRIILSDWSDLEPKKLKGPLTVVLNFDLFCHDPGDPPDRFLDEISAWIAKQRPGLLMLELSAAGQQDPSKAWSRFVRFIEEFGPVYRRADWYLEAGERGSVPEGQEEKSAWSLWADEPDVFGRRNQAFLPGAGILLRPPVDLRRELLASGVKPGDEAAKDIISGWSDRDASDLERRFPGTNTDEALGAAAAALEDVWDGLDFRQPEMKNDPVGIALRILGKDGDRGCLAIYHGISDPLASVAYCASAAARDPRYPPVLSSEREDLQLEFAVFGPWREMRQPLDFRPGLDSVMLVDGNDVTLIQASIGLDRGYDREEFLARLANKAGLGFDGWQKKGIRFMRASTIWSRISLPAIEAMPAYQKKEKK